MTTEALCMCLQAVRLSDHRERLFFAGFCFESQPLSPKRAGPELQSSRRVRSKAAVHWTQQSTLEAGNSQVNKIIVWMC